MVCSDGVQPRPLSSRASWRVQVRCVHPRHPNPHKQYALKLVVNYATLSKSRDVARRYGLDCIVLRKLPQRHTNLCSLLAEFTSAVPDEMFEHLTPVPRVLMPRATAVFADLAVGVLSL
jgi:hypothetical protein